ncbi:MAG: uracil-DNA glycosylase [Burkholderiaceae bacterium]|nr:uracil-DNA glycosylase [Burkholderiaceae bacterium]
MNKGALLSAPSLDSLQIAWLQEIGLDRHMLARWAAPQPIVLAPPQVVQANDVPDSAAVVAVPPVDAPAALPRLSIAPPKLGLQRATPVMPGTEPPAPPVPMPQDWAGLQLHAQACQSCELHLGRSSVVFGAGVQESPQWMIIGEAPGASDDRGGLPFQGKPGQLLQAMLASIGLGLPAALQKGKALQPTDDAQASVYCTNVIKCRPLGNRTPTAEEIAACMPYLQRQIDVLQPERILALGHLAAQALLGLNAPLDDLRGKVHQVRSASGRMIPLVATWHPATLLLRPQHKADVWDDLNLALTVGQH